MTGMSEKRIVPPLEESPLAPKSSTPAISPRRAGPLYYGIYAQFLRQSAPFKGTDVLKAALAQGDKEHYQINNFDILEKIGVGAYGKVLKVKHKDTGRILAMKCVNVGHLGKQRQLEALNEVQVLKGLRHQNIITYWGSFIEGNKLCILMELATNGDLMHLIRKQREKKCYFGEREIWRMMWQLSVAILHLHANNIIHRDIKALNIFLTGPNQIKLGDVGESKYVEDMNSQKGSLRGTPLYLAPELIKDRTYDVRVDCWTLGCVLYELMTLHPPFPFTDVSALIKSILHKNPKPVPSCYSQQLTSLVSQLLEKNLPKRPYIDQILHSFPKKMFELSPQDNLNLQKFEEQKLSLECQALSDPFLSIIDLEFDAMKHKLKENRDKGIRMQMHIGDLYDANSKFKEIFSTTKFPNEGHKQNKGHPLPPGLSTSPPSNSRIQKRKSKPSNLYISSKSRITFGEGPSGHTGHLGHQSRHSPKGSKVKTDSEANLNNINKINNLNINNLLVKREMTANLSNHLSPESTSRGLLPMTQNIEEGELNFFDNRRIPSNKSAKLNLLIHNANTHISISPMINGAESNINSIGRISNSTHNSKTKGVNRMLSFESLNMDLNKCPGSVSPSNRQSLVACIDSVQYDHNNINLSNMKNKQGIAFQSPNFNTQKMSHTRENSISFRRENPIGKYNLGRLKSIGERLPVIMGGSIVESLMCIGGVPSTEISKINEGSPLIKDKKYKYLPTIPRTSNLLFSSLPPPSYKSRDTSPIEELSPRGHLVEMSSKTGIENSNARFEEEKGGEEVNPSPPNRMKSPYEMYQPSPPRVQIRVRKKDCFNLKAESMRSTCYPFNSLSNNKSVYCPIQNETYDSRRRSNEDNNYGSGESIGIIEREEVVLDIENNNRGIELNKNLNNNYYRRISSRVGPSPPKKGSKYWGEDIKDSKDKNDNSYASQEISQAEYSPSTPHVHSISSMHQPASPHGYINFMRQVPNGLIQSERRKSIPGFPWVQRKSSAPIRPLFTHTDKGTVYLHSTNKGSKKITIKDLIS